MLEKKEKDCDVTIDGFGELEGVLARDSVMKLWGLSVLPRRI
jgi:hypothetical protein